MSDLDPGSIAKPEDEFIKFTESELAREKRAQEIGQMFNTVGGAIIRPKDSLTKMNIGGVTIDGLDVGRPMHWDTLATVLEMLNRQAEERLSATIETTGTDSAGKETKVPLLIDGKVSKDGYFSNQKLRDVLERTLREGQFERSTIEAVRLEKRGDSGLVIKPQEKVQFHFYGYKKVDRGSEGTPLKVNVL